MGDAARGCGRRKQGALCNWVCLAGEVRMPSGKTARPNITDNKDGTITVRYAPTEKGLHQMGIKYDGNHIPGESGAGPGGLRATLLLLAFFQQTLIEHLLCADTLGGPGRLTDWWEAVRHLWAEIWGPAGRLLVGSGG